MKTITGQGRNNGYELGDETQLVPQHEDEFGETVAVYTYDNGEVIEKRCEVLGYPNLTTDGELMYDDTRNT